MECYKSVNILKKSQKIQIKLIGNGEKIAMNKTLNV